ncbi:unnamed protein product [Adineta ricciae]|uniref:Metallo-beta-lactamase domain-containing protein n=1 Tax=Adineta ricciae TaxID=249248 RepID=A0A815EGW5_ADIRI|nr:unnamed protein product [Adineta ricciae]CAF1311265.1 unnamed protein product [Adineta ricciae]
MPVDHSDPVECLLKHNEEFTRQIITVLPGIHCAIGYGLANSILIEGNDGNIIVDTLESRESAEDVKKDFDKISSKPVVAIIYTHNHSDHVFGAEVFANETTKVYSHAKTLEILDKTMNLVQPITFQRAARQFGVYLNKETGHINSGIGSLLNYNQTNRRAYLPPTDTFSGRSLELDVAGRKLILYHAPGETDDQIVVHMPNENVLLAADNIYKAFPNIYAIRGTTTRDPIQWIASLDLMRNLRAEYLIPSHTKPMVGKDEIYQTITVYRDAVQFVHDQTIRCINKGLTPDEIIGNQLVQLPKKLNQHPYLQQFYGNVPWTIRAVFDRYLGWFSGKTSDLHKDAPKTHAENLVKFGGGAKEVFAKAQSAFQEEKYRWTLELVEALSLYPEDVNPSEINELHCSTLEKLAAFETSANGRNWYMTKRLEIQGLIHIKPSEKQIIETVSKSSIKKCLQVLPVNFNYQKAEIENLVIFFHFNDTNEKYSVELRNSIVDVQDCWNEQIKPDLAIEIKTERIWKEILVRAKTPMDALDNKDISIKNQQGDDYPEGILQLVQFLLLFAP